MSPDMGRPQTLKAVVDAALSPVNFALVLDAAVGFALPNVRGA
jgi:hypothetical protein